MDDYTISKDDLVRTVMGHGERLSSVETAVSMYDNTLKCLNDSYNALFKGYVPSWAALFMTVMGAAVGFLSAIAFHH